MRVSRGLLLVLALAALLRLAPLAGHRFQEEHITIVDSHRYLELAENLSQGRGFTSRQPHGELQPEVFRTPGYALAIAALTPLPGEPLIPLLILQVGLAVLLVFFTYGFARNLVEERAALVAALIVAMDVGHIVYTHLVMSDILAATAVAAAFGLALAIQPTTGSILGAGVLLSLASSCRPVLALLFLPLAFFLWRRGLTRKATAAFVLLALVFPLGWTLRNGMAAGVWSLSTAFDVNLALLAAPKVESRAKGQSLAAAQAALRERVQASLRSRPDTPRHRIERQAGLGTLRQHPRETAMEMLASAAEMLLAGERRYLLQVLGRSDQEEPSIGESRHTMVSLVGAFRQQSGLAWTLVGAQLLLNSLLALCGGLGAWTLIRRRRHLELFLLLAALAVVLLPSLVVATARMRIPVAMFLATLAGVGADSALGRLGR
jgi:4-amino-4-deoxy-L-arabinose transferase-like glycosyltransferase